LTGALEVATDGATVGTFPITQGTLANDNYTITFTGANLEVKAPVVVTATATNGTVTGAGTYAEGETVTLVATPDAGYRFVGWFVDDTTVSTAATYTFTATADIALVAKFERTVVTGGSSGGATAFTVKFDSNGGTKVANQSVRRNTTAKEPADPTREGYIFAGWYTDAELTQKYDFTTAVKRSFTLFAGWYETEEEAAKKQIKLTIGETEASVWGEKVENDVAPIIVNDRTMLPARFVAEALGAKVEWNAEERKVTITSEDVEIIIVIDSDVAFVNGKEVKLDSAAFIQNDRTYTPIRFISENLGANVEWVESSSQVIITK